MSAVDKLLDYRKKTGLPISVLAKRVGVSASVISIVEKGGVTHPTFAKKIQLYYGLTDEEYLEIIPENHREGDPNRYKEATIKFNPKIVPKSEEIRSYINSRLNYGGQ